MADRRDGPSSSLGAAVVESAQRSPWLVLALVAALSMASLWVTATRLRINTDPSTALSPNLPFQDSLARMSQDFGVVKNPLLLIVDSQRPGAARSAAMALGDALKKDSKHFSDVFLPQVAFSRANNELLYYDLPALAEIESRLEQTSELLLPLAADPTVPRLLATATNIWLKDPKALARSLALDRILGSLAIHTDKWLAGDRTSVDWKESILGPSPDDLNGRRYLIIAHALNDFSSPTPAAGAVSAIAAAAEEANINATSDVSLRITGEPILVAQQTRSLYESTVSFAPACLVVVVFLMSAAFLSLRIALAVLASLLVALVFTSAFAALSLGQINPISVCSAVLFVAIGIGFGVHFAVRFRELALRGVPSSAALSEAGHATASPSVLSALTLAVAFFALLGSPYSWIAELGLICGVAILFGLLSTLIVLPALIATFSGATPRRPPKRRSNRMLLELPPLPILFPEAVFVIFAAAALVAATYLTGIRFDSDPLDFYQAGTPAVRTMRELMAWPGYPPKTADVLVANGEAAERTAQKLDALPEVGRTLTISNILPHNQTEKFKLFRQIDTVLNVPVDSVPVAQLIQSIRASQKAAETKIAASGPEPLVAQFPDIADLDDNQAGPQAAEIAIMPLRQSLRAMEEVASRHLLPTGLAALHGAMQRVLARIEAAGTRRAELNELDNSLLSEVPALIEELRGSLPKRELNVKDLSVELRRRFIGDDGSQRIMVFPSANLSHPKNVEAFAGAVLSVAADATGSAVAITQAATATRSYAVSSLAGTVIAMFFILALSWAGIRDAAVVLTAALVTLLFSLGSAAAMGLNMTFASLSCLPLIAGIAVSGGVFLVDRNRRGGPRSRTILHTSTTRAVIFSALASIAALGPLSLSAEPGLSGLGTFLSMGVAYGLTANLLLLPALLTWTASIKRR